MVGKSKTVYASKGEAVRMESANTMDRMLCLFQACRDAVEYEKKLSKWLDLEAKISVEYEASDLATACLIVDDREVCRLTSDDPVSSLDELMCWVWATMVRGDYTNMRTPTIEA
jgi:hypothetical protein